MADGLQRQSDLEALVAWMDGELPAAEAERVARLVREDPAWRATHGQFLAVDRAVELAGAVSPGPDLTDRIVRAARRRGAWSWTLRIAAPAAAAILLVVVLAWPGRPPPSVSPIEAKIAAVLKDVPAGDRFIVQKLSLFENYEVIDRFEQIRDVADLDTLSALVDLESGEL